MRGSAGASLVSNSFAGLIRVEFRTDSVANLDGSVIDVLDSLPRIGYGDPIVEVSIEFDVLMALTMKHPIASTEIGKEACHGASLGDSAHVAAPKDIVSRGAIDMDVPRGRPA